MVKKLHFKSLLLIAVMLLGGASTWGAKYSSVLVFDCADASQNGSQSLYGVANTATMGNTALQAFLNKAAGVTNKITVASGAVTGSVYWAKGQGGTGIPSDCLKVGKASGAGAFTFSIDDSYSKVDRVVITGYGWKNTSAISVNSSESQTPTSAATETTFTFDLESSTRTISVSVTTSAVCITSIELFAATTGPEITASDVDLAYNATSGEIPYTITNPSDATLTAAKTMGDWISNVAVDVANHKVTFEATKNTSFVEREGTITLSYTGADAKVVTITQAARPATPTLVYDFTNAGWNFPADYEQGAASYTNGATVSFGASSKGHKAMKSGSDIKGVIFGTQDATLSLSAFPFNVSRIKVYGISGASGKVTFNVFVGDAAASTEVTGATGTQVFDIAEDKQTSGNIFTIKVTNENNCQISRIEVFGYENVPVGEAGMATFCSTNDLDFTDIDDIDVYKATVVEKTINFTRIKKVPANTGVLLRNSTGAKAEVAVNVPVLSVDDDEVEGNLFVAATVAIEDLASISADGSKNYILNDGSHGLGFYLANGHNVGAGKAYLHVPGSTGAKGFITFDDATGIELVDTANEVAAPVYNLQGQRVSEGYKGVVIVNGKKIMMK